MPQSQHVARRAVASVLAALLLVGAGCPQQQRADDAQLQPASQPGKAALVHDGISVICPAIACDDRSRGLNAIYFGPEVPIDLVVLGNARLVEDKAGNRDHILYEVAVKEVLYGYFRGKKLRFGDYSYVHDPDTGDDLRPRIYGLVWPMSDDNTFGYRYYLPAGEKKSQQALARARLGYHALSARWIFVGKETREVDDYGSNRVRVTRPILGPGLKSGAVVTIFGSGRDKERKPSSLRHAELIYFIPKRIYTWQEDGGKYVLGTRLDITLEPDIRRLLARRKELPLIKSRVEGKIVDQREVVFDGSVEEAMDLLGSDSLAAVVLGMRSCLHQGKRASPPVARAIEKNLHRGYFPRCAGAWRQMNLIEVLGQIENGKPNSVLGKLLDKLLDHIESRPPQPQAAKDKEQWWEVGERQYRSRTNESLSWLLRTLDERYVADRYGRRLMKLRDTSEGFWKQRVRYALSDARVEDNIGLFAAMDRAAKLPVIRAEPRKKAKPTTHPVDFKPGSAAVVNMFFAPVRRAALIFSPDGKTLRTVVEADTVRTRNAATLAVLKEVKLPKRYEFIAARPTDGRYGICAKVVKRDEDGQPDRYGPSKIIDLDSGRTVCDVPLAVDWGAVRTKAMWLDDNQILILDYGKWHRVNYLTGKVLESLKLDSKSDSDLYNGHGGLPEDGRSLYVIEGGGRSSSLKVYVRDIPTRKKRDIGKIDLGSWGRGQERGLVPGGKFLYWGGPGMHIHDRNTLKKVTSREFKRVSLLKLVFSRDGGRYAVLTGGRLYVDRRLKVHDPGIPRILRVHETMTGRTLYAIRPKTGGVRAMAFSPDGKRLAILRADSVLELRTLEVEKK